MAEITTAIPLRSYSGLRIAARAAVVVLLFSLVGWLRPVNDAVYDQVTRWLGRLAGTSEDVLLVEVDADRFPPAGDEVRRLVDAAEELGARALAFDFVPSELPADVVGKTVGGRPIVFGRELVFDLGRLDAGAESPFDRSLLEHDVLPAESWGIAGVPPQAGVYRHARWTFDVAGTAVPSFAHRISQVDLGDATPPGESFLVDFRRGAVSLPAVSLAQVLEGAVVRPLVQGRVVLVGRAPDPRQPAYPTPLTPRFEASSRLRLHGHAVDTLLRKRWRRAMPLAVTVLLVALTAMLSGMLYQRLPLPVAQWALLGLGLLFAVAYPLALSGVGLVLPLSELFLAAALAAVLSYYRKAVLGHRRLSGLTTDAALKVQQHSAGDRRDGDPWPEIRTMIDQILDYRRFIFFERIPGTRHLRPVDAVGCTADDVAERRRDFTRSPFKPVIDRGRPALAQQAFLKDPPDGEQQFLVPLLVANQVQGFWVIAVDAETRSKDDRLEPVLRSYASAIAKVIFQRRQVSAEQQARQEQKKWFTIDQDAQREREIRGSLAVLEERLDRSQRLLRSLGQAIVAYNLLGRVVALSSTLADLLGQVGIAPYEHSALELVEKLTGADPHQVRLWLREVLMRQQGFSRPLPGFKPKPNTHYVLHVRPLLDDDAPEGEEPQAFDVRGIVLVIDDITENKAVAERTESAWTGYERELRNHLVVFSGVSQMLMMGGSENTLEFGNMIKEKVEETESMLERTRTLLAHGIEGAAALSVYPLHGDKVLQDAQVELEAKIREKKTSIEVDGPGVMREVEASPVRLKDLFVAVLDLLLEDLLDDGGIQVRIVQDAASGMTSFDFENQGYGLPMEGPEDFVGTQTGTLDFALRQMENCRSWAKEWGGQLEIDSKIGRGIRVHLELKTFL